MFYEREASSSCLLRVAGVRLEAGEDSSMRRDARLALRLVLDEHIRPRPAATQTTAAPRVRRVGLRLGPRGEVDVAPAPLRRRRPVADLLPVKARHVLVVRDEPYRRLPRKEVLRLRSLSKRGRAKATDPTIDRVFQLPNELCWHVLDFWRATSAATGEVI